jgi:hypothetical protein
MKMHPTQLVSMMTVIKMKLMKVIRYNKNMMIQEFQYNRESQHHFQHQIHKSICDAERRQGSDHQLGNICYHPQLRSISMLFSEKQNRRQIRHFAELQLTQVSKMRMLLIQFVSMMMVI